MTRKKIVAFKLKEFYTPKMGLLIEGRFSRFQQDTVVDQASQIVAKRGKFTNGPCAVVSYRDQAGSYLLSYLRSAHKDTIEIGLTLGDFNAFCVLYSRKGNLDSAILPRFSAGDIWSENLPDNVTRIRQGNPYFVLSPFVSDRIGTVELRESDRLGFVSPTMGGDFGIQKKVLVEGEKMIDPFGYSINYEIKDGRVGFCVYSEETELYRLGTLSHLPDGIGGEIWEDNLWKYIGSAVPVTFHDYRANRSIISNDIAAAFLAKGS